jgi:hydroxyacylglutathione hydrolase
MPEVMTVETPSLGDRSYLVHDGDVGVVIDPQRDIGRMLSAAQDAGVRITYVLETHIHNDYITGGCALVQATGAAYCLLAADDVSFDRLPVSDGSPIDAGSLIITPMHTPGHTPGHTSYVLARGNESPVAVFTGGSLLYGTVGRTDLISPERTEELTLAQYRSARRLVSELPGEAAVYPTHGFGSFCSATPASGASSTVGRERQKNIAMTSSKETFANRSGPPVPDLTPPARATAAEIRSRIDVGEWVVDLRLRRAFAELHVTGTISVELGDAFCTHLGWGIPWGTPLTLIGGSPEHVIEAQRQLARIGIDHLAGAATAEVSEVAVGQTASYEVADFTDLAAALDRQATVVLDVRAVQEWRAGHLAVAVHIPFWEVETRTAEVPAGVVWVHCASGFRASIAASILERAGRQVIHIDDDWGHAAAAGLPITFADS